MEEKKAKQVLADIQKSVLGKEIRKYTKLDLIRFSKFSRENPDVKPADLVCLYDKKHPEKTAVQKLKNLSKGLDLNIDFDAGYLHVL
jgi:hypothetical protein